MTKETKQRQKKFDDDVMSENCEVIVIFRSFGQFEAVWRPDSGHEPAEVMFSVTVTFGLTKTESRTKKSLTQLSHLL